MRAVVPERPGGPEVLRVLNRPVPALEPGQLLVRVRAAALNHADLLQRKGEFPPPPGESDVLGVEFAGDVVAGGAYTPPGSPVMGLVAAGAYADYCVVDEGMVARIPPGLDYASAASLPEVYFTADTTLIGLGGLAAGMTVLVHGGASGLGTACIQMARSLGARVACTVGTHAKAQKARALGADLAIVHPEADFVDAVRAWTKGVGVDVVEDIVGAAYFERNLAALRDGGCLVQVGVMSGTVCTLDLDTIVLRRLQLKGSVMRPLSVDAKRAIAGRFRDHWLPLIAGGRIVPVVDSVYPLAGAADAHARLERSEHFGKIVLDVHNAAERVAPPKVERT